MTIEEIEDFLKTLRLPPFVAEVNANPESFNKRVGRDYTLFVRLAGNFWNPYRPASQVGRLAVTNNPFNLPKDEDELCGQITAAIMMGITHEIIEYVSLGAERFCDPHLFSPGVNDWDSEQWLWLLDHLHDTVKEYAEYMPVVEGVH
jgi:hypothetical protein